MFPRPARDQDSGERPTHQEESSQHGFVVRACLVVAAVLPWFALFSGTHGLYFGVVLCASGLAHWWLIPLLVLTEPLVPLLLVSLSAGAVNAAVRSPLTSNCPPLPT